jgi:hypothetical protein
MAADINVPRYRKAWKDMCMRFPDPRPLATIVGLGASAIILLATFVLSVIALGFMVGSLVNTVLALAVVGVIPCMIRPPRTVAGAPVPEMPRPWLGALSIATVACAAFAIMHVIIIGGVAIASLAYPPLWGAMRTLELGDVVIEVLIVTVIVLPAGCFALAYLLFTLFPGSKILRRLATWSGFQGRPPLAVWELLFSFISVFASVAGTLSLIVVGATVGKTASLSNLSWGDSATGILIGYPITLLVLAGAALALAILPAQRVQYCRIYAARIGSGGDTAADRARPVNGWLAQAAGLAGLVMVAVGLGGIVSAGVVMSQSGVSTVLLYSEADEGISGWLAQAESEGLDAEAAAARLNAVGHWRSDAPEQGLVELFPDNAKAHTEVSDLACTASLAAAALGEDERAAVAPDSEDQRLVKYCYRLVCRWTGFAEPHGAVTWLISSRVSSNPGWVKTVRSFAVAVFAGTAGPGGYCAANGDLAMDYQG